VKHPVLARILASVASIASVPLAVRGLLGIADDADARLYYCWRCSCLSYSRADDIGIFEALNVQQDRLGNIA